MITKFKIFEYFDNKFEYEDVDLNNILNKAPSRIHLKNKNYIYVINILKKYIGFYVSFDKYWEEIDKDNRKIHHRTIINGIVEDVAYDNDRNNQILYFKVNGEFHSIANSQFTINITHTNSIKYNI